MQQPLTILYLFGGSTKIYNSQDTFFNFAKNHEIEIIIENQCVCKFLWDSDFGFVPLNWNNFLKNRDESVRSYTWEQLLKIIGDSCVVKIIVRDEIPPQYILKLFDMCEFLSYVNYSKTITALETLKIVETKQSSSFIASDSRKFSIIGEEEWYDVDILGTTFGQKVTARITELFRVS